MDARRHEIMAECMHLYQRRHTNSITKVVCIDTLGQAGIVEIRELLLELTREQGVTVFLASHILAEVSRQMSMKPSITSPKAFAQSLSTSVTSSLRRL